MITYTFIVYSDFDVLNAEHATYCCDNEFELLEHIQTEYVQNNENVEYKINDASYT